MEQMPKKRGRPNLFLTKGMVKKHGLLKRLYKNSLRNLQGELPEEEDGGATSNENGASNQNLRTSGAAGTNSAGESPHREDGVAAMDKNSGIILQLRILEVPMVEEQILQEHSLQLLWLQGKGAYN